MNKTLTAYFSPTGNTAAVAKIIAGLCETDLFEIKAKPPYTPEDLDWNDAKSRSSLEMKDPSSRPAIADKVANMGDYKTVFLGFPIWWYEAPRIILTFLESYDLAGKAMIPFATSGSSGLGKTEEHLRNACPAARWLEGARFAQHPEVRTAEKWVMKHQGWKQ